MKFFILITCTLFFVACGGGSSSAATPSPTPTDNQPTSALQGSINDIEEIAKIIFAKNNLGFSSSILLTNFFELFLADLVEDRRL